MASDPRNDIFAKAREWIADCAEEFFVEIIDAYLADAPKRLADLRRALAGGDEKAFTLAAHTLKSSSAHVGAAAFTDLAREIEAASRAGRMAEMQEQVRQLGREYVPIEAALREVRAALLSGRGPAGSLD